MPDPSPTLRNAGAAVGIAALGVLAAVLFVLGIRMLLAAFGGVLIGVLLNAFSRYIEARTPLPYRAALTLVVVALMLVLGAAGWLIAPHVSRQAAELGEEMPALVESVEETMEQYGWGRWVLERARSGRFPGGGDMGAERALEALSDGSTYFLLALLVGLFGAASPRLYRHGIINLIPLPHRPRARDVLDELVHTLQWWLIGQALAMLLIGVSTGVMLWLFGIPFAALFGVLVGLLGFIPFLGPIVGAVPIALIAATQGAGTLLWVMVAYTGIQMLEGYVATPLIQHRMVYLPPVFTILSQFLLGAALGVIGVVFATPLAAVVLVLSRYYRTDVLGDARAEEGKRRR
jgi:predicted PurR-regulated permease PerM